MNTCNHFIFDTPNGCVLDSIVFVTLTLFISYMAIASVVLHMAHLFVHYQLSTALETTARKLWFGEDCVLKYVPPGNVISNKIDIFSALNAFHVVI